MDEENGTECRSTIPDDLLQLDPVLLWKSLVLRACRQVLDVLWWRVIIRDVVSGFSEKRIREQIRRVVIVQLVRTWSIK